MAGKKRATPRTNQALEGAIAASNSDGMYSFIAVTPSARPKPDAASMKHVRSHVMRGRNRRKLVEKPELAKLLSWINGHHPRENKSSNPQPVSGHDSQLDTLPVPRRVGIDLSHLPFAEEMKPYMAESVFTCTYLLSLSFSPAADSSWTCRFFYRQGNG
jgi:hypothetical protein